MTQHQVLIIGIGNVVLRDEGVGVHAAWRLKEERLPPGVEVIDGGTATMDLLAAIQKAERIIVIDAVKGGGVPGTVYRVRPDELSQETEHPLSLHQAGFLDVLGLARQRGGAPEVVIIGVEPKEIAWGMELTPEVSGKLPNVIAAVFAELKGL